MRYTFPQKATVTCDTCDLDLGGDDGFIPAGSTVWILYESDKPYVHAVWKGNPKKTAVVLFNGKHATVWTYTLKHVPMKGHTLVECADENWKTQLARKYPNIPAGETIQVLETNFVNFYGSFCKVLWKDNQYYVKHIDIEVDEGPIDEEGKK